MKNNEHLRQPLTEFLSCVEAIANRYVEDLGVKHMVKSMLLYAIQKTKDCAPSEEEAVKLLAECTYMAFGGDNAD